MDTSRYQLVDSLYGPGTVGAWLLTLCAVLLSWTLNTSSRHKDTISVDLIAALLLPLIAACHTIFQITRLPLPVAEIITAQNVELQRYASALEAPLNICETFSVAALLLAMCCGPWWGRDPKWKRLGLVLIVGLVSWGTENVMFGMGTMKGVHVADTTLSRPYLFFLTPIVASTWAFLALCLAIGGIVWAVSVGNTQAATITRRRDLERRHFRQPRDCSLRDSGPKLIDSSIQINRESMEYALQEYRTLESKSRSVLMMTCVSTVYLPLLLIISFHGLLGVETKSPASPYQNQFFLIPKSNGSLSNLDQLLALVGGIIVILAAVRRAYRSRRERGYPSKILIQRRRSV